ncbi:MAG: SDR family NAD(P)-dependent oxidoreductase [Thermosynechococcaceae cyanobacterium]
MKASSTLAGQVAVVTGGTQGIGLIIAQSLAAAGANVVICSRSKPETYSNLERSKDNVLGVTCDVTDFAQVENLAEQTLDQFGKIDIWFNNAAINRYFGPALDVPLEHWREVIDTNLNGTFHGTMVALKHMLPKNQGKIINVLGAGAQDSPGNSYLSAYATSKAAARRFTLVVAEDYQQTGVSIFGLNPGLMPTRLTTQIQPLNDEAHRRMKLLDFGLRWLATSPQTIGQTAVRITSRVTDGKTGKIYRCWPGISTALERERRNLFKK